MRYEYTTTKKEQKALAVTSTRSRRSEGLVSIRSARLDFKLLLAAHLCKQSRKSGGRKGSKKMISVNEYESEIAIRLRKRRFCQGCEKTNPAESRHRSCVVRLAPKTEEAKTRPV